MNSEGGTHIRARRSCEWQSERSLTILRGWARAGYSDGDIAELMGITPEKLKRLIRKYPSVKEALSESRESANYAVEEALFMRATGFCREIVKPYKLKVTDYDEKGKKLSEHEDIKLVKEQEYFPPDLKAQLTWLQCRVPERWNIADTQSDDGKPNGGILVIPEVVSGE